MKILDISRSINSQMRTNPQTLSTDRHLVRDSSMHSIHVSDMQAYMPECGNGIHVTDEDLELVNRVDYMRFYGYHSQDLRHVKYESMYPLWRYREMAEKNHSELGPQLK